MGIVPPDAVISCLVVVKMSKPSVGVPRILFGGINLTKF